jgi:hypothetical protein
MINVQQKVSAVFRCQAGAEQYCVVSSYISLVRKQDQIDQSRIYRQSRPADYLNN